MSGLSSAVSGKKARKLGPVSLTFSFTIGGSECSANVGHSVGTLVAQSDVHEREE
jgi:hypothetical protein